MRDREHEFEIVAVRGCPAYALHDRFVLGPRLWRFQAPDRPACLVLAATLTRLLAEQEGVADGGWDPSRLYSCGGCTGLVKFRCLGGAPEPVDGAARVYGSLDGLNVAELLQTLHMHQKTGRLHVHTPAGEARVSFRAGALVAARFGAEDNQEAVYRLLRQSEGSFRFVPGLPPTLATARELGDFMTILMEGLRRLDEDPAA